MSIIVVGTNHKYSPIWLREKLVFPKSRIRDALYLLKEYSSIEKAVILSTCNRVEIYASTENLKDAKDKIIGFISRYHEIDKDEISRYLYVYYNEEAIKHLFSVACGLDSLILGETQILTQVRGAYIDSEDAGFLDEALNDIFNKALLFAKTIHKTSRISEGKVSTGSIAVDFIKKRLGNLSSKNILVIGVGKITQLTLKYLIKEQPNVIFVSNRTFEKARALATTVKAIAVRFDRLREFLSKADVIITATKSPHCIIKKETLEGAVKQRILMVDLALPRDVDPKVKELENIELFCLEDLTTAIEENLKTKGHEAKRIGKIIDIEVEEQWQGVISLEPEPALFL